MSRRLAAALGLAASGLACASAGNYLDPLGPAYVSARGGRARGATAVYFPSGVHPKHERDFGCAVLSPWPLEEPRKLVLPHGARVSGLRRAAVSATVVRGRQRVRVYSLHMPSPLAISGGARKEQPRGL